MARKSTNQKTECMWLWSTATAVKSWSLKALGTPYWWEFQLSYKTTSTTSKTSKTNRKTNAWIFYVHSKSKCTCDEMLCFFKWLCCIIKTSVSLLVKMNQKQLLPSQKCCFFSFQFLKHFVYKYKAPHYQLSVKPSEMFDFM